MPTYTYNGERTFISDAYGVRVEPGDSCTTRFFLPEAWSDFQLTDANSPEAITPHTKLFTISAPTEISLIGYGYVSIINTVPGTAASVRFGSTEQDIFLMLDDRRSDFEMRIADNVSTMYIANATGTPVLNILFSPGSAREGV